jgi:hypothetical protein
MCNIKYFIENLIFIIFWFVCFFFKGGGHEEEEETIQLVSSDGTVQILQKPLRAGQIIQEFPHHLICHSHSLYIGQKTPALSPNDQLEVGNKYFLLPEQFFQSELTLVLLASLISPPQNLQVLPVVAYQPLCAVSNVRLLSASRLR